MRSRRQAVFAVAMATAGLAVSILAVAPLFVTGALPEATMAPSGGGFFFDVLGWVCGFWLLSWVSAVCGWRRMARMSQWFGIIVLCVDQVLLLGIWKAMLEAGNALPATLWLAPVLLQLAFLGYFFGFFTMPSLAMSGNLSLSGLGTLAVLFPWVIGRETIISGTQAICSFFH